MLTKGMGEMLIEEIISWYLLSVRLISSCINSSVGQFCFIIEERKISIFNLLTQCIFRKYGVQNTIRCEFCSILMFNISKISVQHFQLCLAHIKLFIIALFHSNKHVRLINENCKCISYALYLLLK